MRKRIPRVLIDNRQKKKRLNLAKISRTTSTILNLLGERKGEVSISFVTNRVITALNKKYLSAPRSTDVLAFPMRPSPVRRTSFRTVRSKSPNTTDPPSGRNGMRSVNSVLGDVVISVEKTLTQARKYSQPFEKELTRLIVHGILHLIGYRDKQKRDKIKMDNLQEGILSTIYETP